MENMTVDKHGTKHYYSDKCPKCGGTGYLHCYDYVEGGICFKCNGSGIFPHSWVEYTAEYAKVLEERRIARREKVIAKAVASNVAENIEHVAKLGFSQNLTTNVILGDTFSQKETLKALGAKFDAVLGWHSARKLEGFDSFEFDASEHFEYHKDGLSHLKWYSYPDVKELIDSKKKAYDEAKNGVSNYLGVVGEVLNLTVVFVRSHAVDTQFGTSYINIFKKGQDVIVWKTGVTFIEGKTYDIKGRVKELNEYKGAKQTVLTRCKINAEGGK